MSPSFGFVARGLVAAALHDATDDPEDDETEEEDDNDDKP